jgi:hypothetical protein
MAGLATHKVDWTEIFDSTELFDSTNPIDGAPLVVDIGGAHGVDLMRLLAKHPEIPAGALVLQDRPDVVAMTKLEPRISKMAYDFFTPQPVQGIHTFQHPSSTPTKQLT